MVRKGSPVRVRWRACVEPAPLVTRVWSCGAVRLAYAFPIPKLARRSLVHPRRPRGSRFWSRFRDRGGPGHADQLDGPAPRRHTRRRSWPRITPGFSAARSRFPTTTAGRAARSSRSRCRSSRRRATKIGTLFANPGGPGAPGRDVWTAPAQSASLRESFDLVGFDPRGVGETKPAFDCEPRTDGPAEHPQRRLGPGTSTSLTLRYREGQPGLPEEERRLHRPRWHQQRGPRPRRDARRGRGCQAELLGDELRLADRLRLRLPLSAEGAGDDPRRSGRAEWKLRPISPRLRSRANDEALRFIRSVSPATYAAVISTRNSLFASQLDIGTAGRPARFRRLTTGSAYRRRAGSWGARTTGRRSPQLAKHGRGGPHRWPRRLTMPALRCAKNSQ